MPPVILNYSSLEKTIILGKRTFNRTLIGTFTYAIYYIQPWQGDAVELTRSTLPTSNRNACPPPGSPQVLLKPLVTSVNASSVMQTHFSAPVSRWGTAEKGRVIFSAGKRPRWPYFPAQYKWPLLKGRYHDSDYTRRYFDNTGSSIIVLPWNNS